MSLEWFHDPGPEFPGFTLSISTIYMLKLRTTTSNQFHVDPAFTRVGVLPGTKQRWKTYAVTEPDLDQPTQDAPSAYRGFDGIPIPSIRIRCSAGDPVKCIGQAVSTKHFSCEIIFVTTSNPPDDGRSTPAKRGHNFHASFGLTRRSL